MFENLRDLFTYAEFIIRYEGENTPITKGHVSPGFVRETSEFLRDQGVDKARIIGIKTGNSVVLKFNKQLKDSIQQRIRNMWTGYSR